MSTTYGLWSAAMARVHAIPAERLREELAEAYFTIELAARLIDYEAAELLQGVEDLRDEVAQLRGRAGFDSSMMTISHLKPRGETVAIAEIAKEVFVERAKL